MRGFSLFSGSTAPTPGSAAPRSPTGAASAYVPPTPRPGIGAASADSVAARLPPRWAAIYRALVAEQEDITSVANELHRKRMALRDGRSLALQNLKNAQAPGGGVHPDARLIAFAERELAQFDA